MRILFLIVFILLSLHSSPQARSDSAAYIKNDDLSAAFTAGVGWSNQQNKIAYGISGNLILYNIIFSVRTTISGYFPPLMMDAYRLQDVGILAGYRLAYKRISADLSAGYCWNSYKCLSGSSYGCYKYPDEKLSGYTLQLHPSVQISSLLHLGLLCMGDFNRRSDLYNILMTLSVDIP